MPSNRRTASLLRALISLSLVVPMAGLATVAADPPAREGGARTLATMHWQQGILARDRAPDPIRAGHAFLQAGLAARAAGDEQGAIDAGHAAQGAMPAVECTFPHDSPVAEAVVSPNGEFLATWTRNDSRVWLWSLKGREHIRTLQHGGTVTACAFHPRERLLVTGSVVGATVWSFDRNEPLGQFDPARIAGRKGYSKVAFHPNGKDVLVWSPFSLFAWRPGNADPHGELKLESIVKGSLYDADNGRLLTWGDDGIARLWNIEKWELVRAFKHDGKVTQAFFRPGTQEVLTWAEKSPPGMKVDDWPTAGYLWSPDGDQPLHVIPNGQGSRRMEVSPDGSQLLTWGVRPLSNDEMNRATLWSLAEGKPVAFLPHEAFVGGACFRPNGAEVMTWGEDGTAKLWSRADGKLLKAWTDQNGVREIVFQPGGERFVLLDGAGSAGVWKVPPPTPLWGSDPETPEAVFRHDNAIGGAIFLNDGERLLTWSEDGTARVWDAGYQRPQQPVMRVSVAGRNPDHLRWIGKNRFLAFGSHHDVSCWEVGQDKPLWMFPPDPLPREPQYFLQEFSSTTKHLFATTRENSLELWPTSGNSPLNSWKRFGKSPGRRPEGLFLADGERYVIYGIENVELRTVADMKPLRAWRTEHVCQKVIPHPDGRRLLALCRSDRDLKGEIVVLATDRDEPLLRIPYESDITATHLLPHGREMFTVHYSRRDEKAIGRFRPLDRDEPRLTIECSLVKDCTFDAEGKFLLGWNLERRLGWLWSVETGKLLKQFHQRPLGTRAADENDLIHFRIDPAGRFLVHWGGVNLGVGGRLKVWSLANLEQPLAVHDFRGGISDVELGIGGALLVSFGRRAELISAGSRMEPLRRLNPAKGTAYRSFLADADTGRVLTVNMGGELFEWRLAGIPPADLPQHVQEFEYRTAMASDETGKLHLLPFDEWSQRGKKQQ